VDIEQTRPGGSRWKLTPPRVVDGRVDPIRDWMPTDMDPLAEYIAEHADEIAARIWADPPTRSVPQVV
jgi:hypothetical protein